MGEQRAPPSPAKTIFSSNVWKVRIDYGELGLGLCEMEGRADRPPMKNKHRETQSLRKSGGNRDLGVGMRWGGPTAQGKRLDLNLLCPGETKGRRTSFKEGPGRAECEKELGGNAIKIKTQDLIYYQHLECLGEGEAAEPSTTRCKSAYILRDTMSLKGSADAASAM